jgi:hypothetical protein
MLGAGRSASQGKIRRDRHDLSLTYIKVRSKRPMEPVKGASTREEYEHMPGEFLEAKPRDFNPLTAPALTKEARDGVNAALKALSTWRNEIADTNQKNGKKVVEQMAAAAAAALGWPEQVVNAARTQLQSIADMQIKTMDQLTDAWEEQIKLPNPMTASPSTMLSKLKSLPGVDSSRRRIPSNYGCNSLSNGSGHGETRWVAGRSAIEPLMNEKPWRAVLRVFHCLIESEGIERSRYRGVNGEVA